MSEEMFGNGTADKKYDSLVGFDAAVFRTLQAQLARAEEEEAEARGTKGSAIKRIEEADFDKWAFKQAKSLVGMTPTKAQERLVSLLGYCLVNGTFDQLDIFSRDEILKRIVEIVAIANDRAGEVGLDISYATSDEDEQNEDVGSDEDDGMSEETDQDNGSDSLAAANTDETDIEEDETGNGDDIDAQPEDSGAIFNTGKAHAEAGGYKEDCPYDGRTAAAKLWNKGYNSVSSSDDEGDQGNVVPFGDEAPSFPTDNAQIQ
jgi:hypothetical protein